MSGAAHTWRALGAALLTLALAACGGGGDGGSATPGNGSQAGSTAGPGAEVALTPPAEAAANVLTIRLDRGIDNSAINAPFVTVTVCQPGTSTCVDIDHVLVDTGSAGLRVAASALPWSLPGVTTPSGAPVGECAQFASGYAWGGVRRADVRLGGLTAAGLPVQVVADTDPAFATVPAACTAVGPSVGSGRGARGILGIGLFSQDCGAACELRASPGVYYACPGGTCTATQLAVASQVRNPVADLPSDNNGVVLRLPAVPSGGSAGATGALVLGIGTRPNNQLGTATVYTANAQGFFTTTYKGTTYPRGFLDSGSNGLFFDDPSLPTCGDFYCPPTTPLALSATNTSAAGVVATVPFSIDSITSLPAGTAVASIAGPIGLPGYFDWGLPFFLGRTVFVARAGATTPAGTGPYWAY